MLARVRSAAVLGIEAYLVDVEVDLASGLPAFATVGLPQAAVKEGREAWRGEGCCGAIGSHHGAGEVDGCGCTDGGCADGCCTPAGTTADTAAAGAPAAGDPEVFQIGGLRPSGRDEHS